MHHFSRSARRTAFAFLLPAAALAYLVTPAEAHETDQFSMPPYGTQELAEMGDHLRDILLSGMEKGVRDSNAQITRALDPNYQKNKYRARRSGGRTGAIRKKSHFNHERVLARHQSPVGVTAEIRHAYKNAVYLIEKMERDYRSKDMRAQYAPDLPAYFPPYSNCVYTNYYLPIDPRITFRLWRASTMKHYGYYVGNDKWGHFIDMGYHYYSTYKRELRKGKSEQEAHDAMIRLGTKNLIFSESGLLGNFTASAYSNADLVSNYVGCLFYLNLTERVEIKGVMREPMLERDGNYWRISQRVYDDPNFFARFASDHLNEALNPSLFAADVRKPVRKNILARSENLLLWYSDMYGDQNPEVFFEQKVRELSTYYGKNYGHSGEFEKIMHIGNTLPEGYAERLAAHRDQTTGIPAESTPAPDTRTSSIR